MEPGCQHPPIRISPNPPAPLGVVVGTGARASSARGTCDSAPPAELYRRGWNHPCGDVVERNASSDATPAPTYTLNEELKKGLQEAWERSRRGKHFEEGGILVETADRAYQWRAGVGTEKYGFFPNYGDRREGDTIVATAHTHHLSKGHGDPGINTFSHQDLGRMAVEWVPEDRQFVQSGTMVFMVHATQEFKDDIAQKGPDGAQVTRNEIISRYEAVYAAAKGTFLEQTEAATKAVCKEFHLEYYRGSGDTLTQVDVSR